MLQRRLIEYEMDAQEMSASAIEELEQALARSPDNLELRLRRLGTLRPRGLPWGEEVLWVVTHHPEVNLRPDGSFLRLLEPDAYEPIVAAWEAHIARTPGDVHLLKALSSFVMHEDDARSEELMRQCIRLEPHEPQGMADLANFLGRHLVDAPAEQRGAMAAEALSLHERALWLETGELGAHLRLIDVAQAAAAAGQMGRARQAAETALGEAARFESTWQFGNSIHHGNIVLGLVALDAGDIEEAARRLVDAGQTRGSPQLDSFGPDRELANRLLAVGAREAVKTYLQDCQRFWRMDRGRLDRALDRLDRGETPTLWEDEDE